MKEYRLLINGIWVESRENREIRSPYDNKKAAVIHLASPGQVMEAVTSAHHAFEKTRVMPSWKRSQVLSDIARGIEFRQEELARSVALCAGKPIASARIEVSRAANTFTIAAEEAKRLEGEIIPLDLIPGTEDRWGFLRRFPLGVIAGITPFNFPLNLVAHKVAPAIASGNTCVLRPATQVAPTAAILAEIINETDYPDGAFNYVPCGYKAADVLVDDDRVKKISFTGSPEIGWKLKQRAFKKKVTLELGGNAAVVIEPGASLDFALSRTVMGAYSYAGQVCISIQRIYLHQDIYDYFLENFVTAVKKLKLGDPLDEETSLGPMINSGAAEQTEDWIQEAVDQGAEILCGGSREGAMFEATVLRNVRPDLRISRLEAFAPVAVVYVYRDYEDALEQVNDSIYGLQAGVFTNDLQKAFRAYEKLDVGGVIINDIPTFRIDHMPYGGVKESGSGREGLRYAMEEMTELKLMALNLKK